jgi:response regulator RpfG family c-di-GMP phosphodiesterase
MIGLAITVWAAVLGLTAILVGTLCDERGAKVDELHEAYVGVVEVLSRYLQSADPRVKARSTRIAEMCQLVAEQLNLSRKQVDDVRVGALLCDLGNIEITTKLISKAMNTLESKPGRNIERHTFLGLDLVQSLGSVLHGAVPLMMNQEDALRDALEITAQKESGDVPVGARIIRAVRAFDTLMYSDAGSVNCTPHAALRQLRNDGSGEYDPDVLSAIERVARHVAGPKELEPALV